MYKGTSTRKRDSLGPLRAAPMLPNTEQRIFHCITPASKKQLQAQDLTKASKSEVAGAY